MSERYVARREDFSGYTCMVFDENGNATEGFDFTPEDLDLAAKALRMTLGELTTVSVAPAGCPPPESSRSNG